MVLVRQHRHALLATPALLLPPAAQTASALVSTHTSADSAVVRHYVDVARRLAPFVETSDTISAEALGNISYRLMQHRFHDPVGLTDAHLAKHGEPSPWWGKEDIRYTLDVVRPAVLVWHWSGHMQHAPRRLLDNYRVFCRSACDSWGADVVMIRHDRADALSPAFMDWKAVRITSDGIAPR